MSIYRNSRNFHRGKGNIRETEPYQGGNIDGKDTAPELGVSELDPRSQFSVLFISHKETRTKVPRSEIVEKCTGRRFQRAKSVTQCNKQSSISSR
ncbi:hypothetical protein NC652_036827 [Populus alba x Populus x berolinensis]|nr:hypothetical protein NC652_036827 [Populus alba x Populus x berolinensis]